MKTIKKLSQLSLLLCVFVLSACSTKSNNIRTNHASNNIKNISSVLVLSVGEERSSQILEKRTVGQLKAKELKSYSFREENKSGVNEKEVIVTLKKLQADSVLVTKLTSLDVNATVNQGRKEIIRTPSNQGLFGFFHQYDYSRIQNPNEVALGANFKMNAELFSAEDGELLWSAEINFHDVEDSGLALIEMSQLISSALMKQLK